MTGAREYAVKWRQVLVTVWTLHCICERQFKGSARDAQSLSAHSSLSTAFVVTDIFHICGIHGDFVCVWVDPVLY